MSTEIKIWRAGTAAEIARCFAVMRELRPHVTTEEEFHKRVSRQQGEGYEVAALSAEGEVRALAGFRVIEMLFSGRHLYVDDLVTRETDRSAGYGGALFDWLVAEGERRGCATLELDSGVQRFDAHRFYFKKRMKIASYHFSLPLPTP